MTALDRLVALASGLGTDEQAVLLLVAERLTAGRARYGTLDVESDGRDFPVEALEECVDAIVYATCGLMRGGR
jgi:hypothetical protein